MENDDPDASGAPVLLAYDFGLLRIARFHHAAQLHGKKGTIICIGAFAVVILLIMKMGSSDAGDYDENRNFIYSHKGTYGTSGWMSSKEMEGVLEMTDDIRHSDGTTFL